MASHLVFSLLALSFLSLFINGFSAGEISYVKHDVTGATNRNDVKGLTALQSQFVTLQTWSGDPCSGFDLLPWYWIQCTNDPTPRVTSLLLSGYILIGTLPDFSSMDALEIIDLSNNIYLTGPIPDFLGTLPNLQELNLANNDFRGVIPASLSNNNNLNLMVTGNGNLCASEKSCNTYNTPSYVSVGKKEKKSNLPIVLGILIPVFIIFWIVVGVFAISHHRRKSAAVAAMVAVTSNVPEMKRQEGEINMATHMDQQGNMYTNPDEHFVDVTHQQNVNP